MKLNKHFTFDEFSEKLWSLFHGQALITTFNSPLNEACFSFQYLERNNVDFYLFESPEPLSLFSFHLPQSLKPKTLLLLDVNNKGLRFNGILCEEHQFALISEKSQHPFCLQIPVNCPILVCDINTNNKQFQELCNSLVPVNIDIKYAQELKTVVRHASKMLPNKDSNVGAILLMRIVEILSLHPTPMRPQSLTGRSRLPRRSFIPKCVDYMMEMSSTDAIKQLAKEKNISEKTIRNAFKETVGFTPKEFEQISKLFAFRRALKQPEIVTVFEAAIASDVYRWSRYASRYSKIFKELPIKTL
ncbi:hypothetical protein [Aliivibrio sifiae]|uniref:HTH araC/xylS-type domain-containing protein n=1 Tax=Aliivibrio sifiae TaxID=566293 RepID=A0A2S7XD88_9GAMM|nr:hypothetical protein [Aliivibrio sifiae]PQJ89328.1 hypothetical protein BTO22_06900 [Aliivibrio sifiae]